MASSAKTSFGNRHAQCFQLISIQTDIFSAPSSLQKNNPRRSTSVLHSQCLFLTCVLFPGGPQRVKAGLFSAYSDYTTPAIVLVFGPGGEEGQFADMSEPAARRRRLLSSAGAEVCKQEEQR